MELKIVEDKKNRLVIDIVGESHTLANSVRQELWNDEHVKVAGYSIEHPLIDIPKLVVETDGEDPRKVLKAAIKRVKKQVEKVGDEASKIK